MSVVDRSFDHPLKFEEHAAVPLAGGVMQQGYQCSMLWGAALAAGAQAYRLHGPGPQAETEAVIAAQRLVASFRTRNKAIDCFEITEIDWKPSSQRRLLTQVFKFFIKGHNLLCPFFTTTKNNNNQKFFNFLTPSYKQFTSNEKNL